MEPVARADALAGGVDHGAHGVQERLARALVVQRREAAREHGEVAVGRDAADPEHLGHAAADALDARGRQHREHPVGARERGGAQQQVDLAAEAAAGDQHEPVAALGELVGELHRDAAAERVADDGHVVVAERGKEVADAAGVGAERVVAAGRG